ncbi:uncharacterized protein [Branchiostoma lanceolatum]|uniref:uncharacterized protein n=1 Tax=Branchiostoma lanceolatum TaxID=7740 RepID=UPI003451FA21
MTLRFGREFYRVCPEEVSTFMMFRSVLLVIAVLFSTAAAEYCQQYGFSCPRKNRGIFLNDDDDEIYCCKDKRGCCDSCWDAVDTSNCANIIDSAVGIGVTVIIGIVVAIVAVVTVAVVLCVCCCCQCAKQGRNQGHVYQPQPQGQQMAVITQQGQYPSAPAAPPYAPAGQYPPPAGQYPPPAGQHPPPVAGQYPPPLAGQYPPSAAYPSAPPPYSQEAPYPQKM